MRKTPRQLLLEACRQTEFNLTVELELLKADIEAHRIRCKAFTPLEKQLLHIINLAADLTATERRRLRRNLRRPWWDC